MMHSMIAFGTKFALLPGFFLDIRRRASLSSAASAKATAFASPGVSNRPVPDTNHLSLALFPLDGVDAIARLLDAIKARRNSMIEQWHALSASRLGPHRALAEQVFRETYLPGLRTAVEAVARGDTASFVAFAGDFGARVAAAGLPFAVVVAHLNLLKESCVRVLAGEATEVSAAILLMDKLTACFVSVAAEGYYEPHRNGDQGATGEGAVCRRARPEPRPRVFHGMVGGSDVMQQVFAQIRRVAISRAPVLVVGETGTGKELAARAVHAAGPRRRGPFIALNCAALPRELIESELFGHKRGAFSGAVSECLGLFRAAAGGTLLLDEITEMAPDLQAKLLRVLQERTVRPVGSTSEEPIDVRILASTNRDPAGALRSGQLRPDLYYRLCVTSVTMPSLRKRRDDIPALVEYQLVTLNRRVSGATMQVRGVAPDAMRLLVAHEWPGNVRELFNVVENAFTMGGPLIRPESLELAGEPASDPTDDGPRLATFEEHERSLIERALAQTRGNKLRAARELGISRKKLYARMARYGLLTLIAGMVAMS